jgi:hypothetical protein
VATGDSTTGRADIAADLERARVEFQLTIAATD